MTTALNNGHAVEAVRQLIEEARETDGVVPGRRTLGAQVGVSEYKAGQVKKLWIVEAVRKAIADSVAEHKQVPDDHALATKIGVTIPEVQAARDALAAQSGLPWPTLDLPVGDSMGEDDAQVDDRSRPASETGRPVGDGDQLVLGDDEPAAKVAAAVGEASSPAGERGSAKVARRRRQVAERTELVALDVQDADLTMTVHRQRIDTAAAEHALRQLPNYRAYLARRIRVVSAVVGAALMIGMGAWSAVGVHHAIAADAPRWSSAWIAGWVLEPILLTGVALIILARSMISLAGGRLHGGVWAIELAILALSVAANIKALPDSPSLADVVVRLTAPLFCVLISVVLGAIDTALDQIRPMPGSSHQ